MDSARAEDGVIVEVIRGKRVKDWLQFPKAQQVVCGQLWDGTTLSNPTPAEQPPPRRLIPKDVVHNRLKSSGLLGAAWGVLNSNPDLLGRWLMPGHANVYFDDEGLMYVLRTIGCTAKQVEAITAP